MRLTARLANAQIAGRGEVGGLQPQPAHGNAPLGGGGTQRLQAVVGVLVDDDQFVILDRLLQQRVDEPLRLDDATDSGKDQRDHGLNV